MPFGSLIRWMFPIKTAPKSPNFRRIFNAHGIPPRVKIWRFWVFDPLWIEIINWALKDTLFYRKYYFEPSLTLFTTLRLGSARDWKRRKKQNERGTRKRCISRISVGAPVQQGVRFVTARDLADVMNREKMYRLFIGSRVSDLERVKEGASYRKPQWRAQTWFG